MRITSRLQPMVGHVSAVDIGVSRVEITHTAVDGPKVMRNFITEKKLSNQSAYDFLYVNCLERKISKNLVLKRLSEQDRKTAATSVADAVSWGGVGGVIKTQTLVLIKIIAAA